MIALVYGENLFANRALLLPLVLIGAALLSWLFTWMLVVRHVNQPIDQLVDGMNRLAEKEFDFRLDEDDESEFGDIAESFNDMASMLSASLIELKKNQDYQRSIVESSSDIIITVNSSGNIQTINSGAENILGYRRLDLIGRPADDIFSDPGDRVRIVEKMRNTDNLANYQTRFVTRKGEVRDVLFSISQLRNPSGAVIGTIGIGKDITEEKRLQEELIQSQRLAAIGEVSTGIQHSMKNMLNACQGGAYMVKIGLRKDNRKMLEEGWNMVEEGITRLTKMARDMLQYVKEWKPRPERIQVDEILSEIERVIRQTATDKGIRFCVEVPDDLPMVYCDGRMIHSVVMDLVSNSMDACLWKDYADNESPEVKISAGSGNSGKDLVIEVKDNGCGMSEDVQEKIFTPFFSTKSKSGTGLGLSMTSRMIGVHGGGIVVESQVDKGALFRITLPVDGTDENKEESNG